MTTIEDDSNIDHVRVYEDIAGGFRWTAVAGNGEVVASGESHTRREDAERAARGVLGGSIRIVEDES